MKTEISYTDWLDWLAFELTFVELYQSATPPHLAVTEIRPVTWPAFPEDGIETAIGGAAHPTQPTIAQTRQDRCVHHGQGLRQLADQPELHPPRQAGYPHRSRAMTHGLIPPPRGRDSRVFRDEEWYVLVNRRGLGSREAEITQRVFDDGGEAAR